LKSIVKPYAESYNDDMREHEFALFLDYENIHIGMENNFSAIPNIHILIEAIKQKFADCGPIIIGKAYGDWERFVGVPPELQREQIEPVYIGAKRKYGRDSGFRHGVAKNAADIQLALDAQELVYTMPNIDSFILISGDYDFVPLVFRLHKHSKRVCLSGIQADTSRDLRQLVGQDFISIDELLGLKSVGIPKTSVVDWYALVKYLEQREKGTMPFIGRKLLVRQLPPSITGGIDTEDARENAIGEATASGILDLYYVANPKLVGTQTAAIRLNRQHEFVNSIINTPTI
jgi:uncharacterized LabA/DUF88 family protein